MAVAVKKPIVVDFSDPSGGCCGVEHPTRFFQNQVSDKSIGFSFKKSGIYKQYGAIGLARPTTFTSYLRGMFSHLLFSGVENLYAVSAGQLNLVSLSDGTLTQKYDMGGQTNEAVSCDAYGKKFVCNGNKVVKIEDSTAFQTGITLPSGGSAAAAAGSGLNDGDYSVYVGYARKVSGTNVLYSKGESLGTVTLSGGNNRISITVPNSSDPQVNNKVVWLKATTAGELIHYFFYETNDNTTVSFTVSSDSQKETAIVYEYAAADNGLPPAITYIFSFAGRLWGIIDNVIYWSNDGTFSQYNVEKWGAANYRLTAHKLTGIFSVGLNLYFNTVDGILLLPYGDINQKEILIEDRWHFYDMNTVGSWNNGVIGLTNQGIKLFDGSRFNDFDYGYPIKDSIEKIYNAPSDFRPCGFVYRQKFRDEYHLLWQDSTKSAHVNTTHAVLNLSCSIWVESTNYRLPWEFKHISGNYAVVFKSNNALYIGQSHAYESKIYKESSSTSGCSNVYDSAGTLLTSEIDKNSYLKTRYHIENIAGMMNFDKLYVQSVNEKSFQIRICAGDNTRKKSEWITITPSGGTAVVFPVVFPVVFQSDEGRVDRQKLPSMFWCKSVYVEVQQSANDVNFSLLNLVLYGVVEVNNYL